MGTVNAGETITIGADPTTSFFLGEGDLACCFMAMRTATHVHLHHHG